MATAGKGAGKGVVSQPLAIAALRVMLEAGEGRELADARARITVLEAQLEVAQRALVSPYGNNVHTEDPRHRLITWQEFGEDRDEMSSRMAEAMGDAVDILARERTRIHRRMIVEEAGGWDPVGAPVIMTRQELLEIYDTLAAVERILRFNEDSSSEEADSDVESEEDVEEPVVLEPAVLEQATALAEAMMAIVDMEIDRRGD